MTNNIGSDDFFKHFQYIKYYTRGDYAKYGDYIHDMMVIAILFDGILYD